VGVAISEREIARMQAVQNRYFPDLADVHRPLTTQNLAGAVAKGDSIVYSQVPCQVSERVLRQHELEHVGATAAVLGRHVEVHQAELVRMRDELRRVPLLGRLWTKVEDPMIRGGHDDLASYYLVVARR